jgi:RimJ/RimL family protein N-acetyltransferase
VLLRPWRPGDEASLVRHANDERVARNLRDLFPHPYTLEDARSWIASCLEDRDPPHRFAIVAGDEAVGGIGFHRHRDVARLTAELGYWLGAALWGRGLATEAVVRVTGYAFERFDLERLEAHVFDSNPASCRVLEKAGYAREGKLRRAVVKDGRLLDLWIYARLRADTA